MTIENKVFLVLYLITLYSKDRWITYSKLIVLNLMKSMAKI